MIYRRTDIATTKHAVNYLPCRLSATQAEPYDPSQHDIRPGSYKLWNKTQECCNYIIQILICQMECGSRRPLDYPDDIGAELIMN